MAAREHHKPGCALDPMHWLRHAIAATNLRVGGTDDENETVDRLASASLLNALEHFAGKPEWRAVTLLEIAEFATLTDEDLAFMCSCDDAPDR